MLQSASNRVSKMSTGAVELIVCRARFIQTGEDDGLPCEEGDRGSA